MTRPKPDAELWPGDGDAVVVLDGVGAEFGTCTGCHERMPVEDANEHMARHFDDAGTP